MTLVLMTSNLGATTTAVGFASGDRGHENLRSIVRGHFRPEFFNRLDDVVPFQPLSEEALRKIVDLEIEKLQGREGFRRRQLRLFVTDAAKAQLARLGFHPKYGARPLKRVIEDRVMSAVAVELARKPKTAGGRVLVDWDEVEFRFEWA
jgi:ATP-dependent Clp protease ATP-binding subunit ClpC